MVLRQPGSRDRPVSGGDHLHSWRSRGHVRPSLELNREISSCQGVLLASESQTALTSQISWCRAPMRDSPTGRTRGGSNSPCGSGIKELVTEPCTPPGCGFRIDHDQKFNQTTNLQYSFAKPWARGPRS